MLTLLLSSLTGLFIVALVPAFIADRNGRDFRLWWVYGVLLPVVAIPVAVMAGPPSSPDAEGRLWEIVGSIVAVIAIPIMAWCLYIGVWYR